MACMSMTRSADTGGVPQSSPVPAPRATTVRSRATATRSSAEASSVLAGNATNDGTTPAIASEAGTPSRTTGQASTSASRTAGTMVRSVAI